MSLVFFVVSAQTNKKNLAKAFKAAEANGCKPVLVYDKYGDKAALNLTHLKMNESEEVSCHVTFSLKAVHKDELTALNLDAEFIHESGIQAHSWCFKDDPIVVNNLDFLKESFKYLESEGFIGDKGKILSANKGDKSFRLPAISVGEGFAAFILENEVSENGNGHFLKTTQHLFSKEVRFVLFHKSNQIEFLIGF
jgi:hypothetical protein